MLLDQLQAKPTDSHLKYWFTVYYIHRSILTTFKLIWKSSYRSILTPYRKQTATACPPPNPLHSCAQTQSLKRKQMLARVEAWWESGQIIKAFWASKDLRPASFRWWPHAIPTGKSNASLWLRAQRLHFHWYYEGRQADHNGIPHFASYIANKPNCNVPVHKASGFHVHLPSSHRFKS